MMGKRIIIMAPVLVVFSDMSNSKKPCPGGAGVMSGKKKPGSARGSGSGTQTLSSMEHLQDEYSVKELNKVPTLIEQYPDLFPRG